jgi:hypothetical protein
MVLDDGIERAVEGRERPLADPCEIGGLHSS